MGAAGIIGAALGLWGAHRQAMAAKDAARAQERAAAEATRTRAYDVVQGTRSREPDSAELGTSNRREKRRGKTSLVIDRNGGENKGKNTSIGLTI